VPVCVQLFDLSVEYMGTAVGVQVRTPAGYASVPGSTYRDFGCRQFRFLGSRMLNVPRPAPTIIIPLSAGVVSSVAERHTEVLTRNKSSCRA